MLTTSCRLKHVINQANQAFLSKKQQQENLRNKTSTVIL